MNLYEQAHAAAAQHQATCDPRGLQDGRPWPACMGDPCRGQARESGFYGLRREYAWAVPDDASLNAIARYSPHGVVEVGAGGGYWARLLRLRDVSVVAYDVDPGGFGGWHVRRWSTVRQGDDRDARRWPQRTLLLCWPDDSDWAAGAVTAHRVAGGRTVIYVGQDADRPANMWGPPVEIVAIPQWADVDDQLEVYIR